MTSEYEYEAVNGETFERTRVVILTFLYHQPVIH